MSWDIAPESARQVLRVMGELAPVGVPQDLAPRHFAAGPDKQDYGIN